MPKTQTNHLEASQWIAETRAQAAKDCITNAVERMRRMLQDIEQEVNREGASTTQVVERFRNAIVWGVANLDSDLANAAKYAHEAETA